MNRHIKWLLISVYAMMIVSLFCSWMARNTAAPAQATTSISAKDKARDKAIIASLKSATSVQVFRSDAPQPRLIPLSTQQRQKIISFLHFAPSNCLPATFPTPIGAKEKSVTFCFHSAKGNDLINLDFSGKFDFYGNSPRKGQETIAILCPESSRALRDLLLQDSSLKEIVAPTG